MFLYKGRELKSRQQVANQAVHDYKNVFLKSKLDLKKLLNIPLNKSKILVLGSGYRYGDVVGFYPFCKEVVGIDIIDAYYRDGFISEFLSSYNIRNIPFGFFRTINRRYALRTYYEIFDKYSGHTINHNRLNLISTKELDLPFGDESFDAVISNAVTEHVNDLDSFFKEASRILKPGGITYHVHHNYCSLSGAHMGMTIQYDNPWAHLRKILPEESYCYSEDLNRIRKDALVKKFSKTFPLSILKGIDKNHNKRGGALFEEEGLEYITDEIRLELSNYSDDELFTRSYLLVGRKV